MRDAIDTVSRQCFSILVGIIAHVAGFVGSVAEYQSVEPMHLRDARVDLNGVVIPIGEVHYPADSGNLFPLPPHDCLVMYATPRAISLAPAHAERHRPSGFLVSKVLGPIVFLPEIVSSTIWQALQSPLTEPVTVVVSGQDSHLAPSRETFDHSSHKQPLSRWTLELADDNGDLAVKLSAALFGTVPRVLNYGNFWPRDGADAQRIHIAFSVDAVTRTAKFGLPLPKSSKLPRLPFHQVNWKAEIAALHSSPRGWPSTLSTLSLERAPIDQEGQPYGFANDSCWILLHGEQHSTHRFTTWEPCYPDVRLSNGFLTGHRLSCADGLGWNSSINMEAIVALLHQQRVTIELRNRDFGLLTDPAEMRSHMNPHPNQRIRSATLDLSIGPRGLTLASKAFINDLIATRGQPYESGWREDEFTIPWEIIILRYPRLLRTYRR